MNLEVSRNKEASPATNGQFGATGEANRKADPDLGSAEFFLI
jgi:hypothetical protein